LERFDLKQTAGAACPCPRILTIPLSKKVRKITCVEGSKANLEILKENLKERGTKNYELINDYWEEAKIEDILKRNRFDLAVCSHFLWQVKDIEGHLKKMENASKRYCAVIQPCGRDELVKKAFEEISQERYTGQFGADAEYFAYVILRGWSRLLDVRYLKYSFELNLEECVRYIASYWGKFIDIDKQVANKIKNFLISEVGEPWVLRDKAVVMWWEPEK